MTLQELGQTIREKREISGLSIEDIAGRIKVSARTLRAIENGSTEGLPHVVYTKGFIRSFALTVGYDPEELNACLEQVFPAETFGYSRPEPGPLNRSMPPPSGLGRKIAVLLLILLLFAGIGFGCWYVVKNYGDMLWDMVKQPFSAISVPSSPNGLAEIYGTSKSSATQTAESLQASSKKDALASASLPPPTGSNQKTEFAPPALPTDTPASAGVAASQPGTSSDSLKTVSRNASAPGEAGAFAQALSMSKTQVLIKAHQPCWIGVRTDGVFTHQTVQANTSVLLLFKETLEVTFGNAKGVTVEYDGKEINTSGKSGQRSVLTFPR